MRTVLLSSVAALGLLATPVLAQSSDQQQGQSGKSPQQQDAQVHAMSQQKLQKSLQQAGFKNITVVDATYLVSAQSPNGDRVMMLIDPPAVQADSGSGYSNGDNKGTDAEYAC